MFISILLALIVLIVCMKFVDTKKSFVRPSFHKRLYGSLEVDNSITKEKLNLKNPYSVEEGIRLMLHPKGTSFKANGQF